MILLSVVVPMTILEVAIDVAPSDVFVVSCVAVEIPVVFAAVGPRNVMIAHVKLLVARMVLVYSLCVRIVLLLRSPAPLADPFFLATLVPPQHMLIR